MDPTPPRAAPLAAALVKSFRKFRRSMIPLRRRFVTELSTSAAGQYAKDNTGQRK
jgi:hypothetical protein